MRRLFLCAVVSCLALGSATLRADDAEDRAIAHVRKIHGQVTRDDKLPGKPVVAVFLWPQRVTAADFKELAAFKHLRSLDIDAEVSDNALRGLAAFPHLTELQLKPDSVTDQALATLNELRFLHALKEATASSGKRPTKSEEVTALKSEAGVCDG